LVKIKTQGKDFGWGCVINFQKKLATNNKKGEAVPTDKEVGKYIVDILLYCDPNSKTPEPCPNGQKGEMQVVPSILSSIEKISSLRVYIPKDIRGTDSRQSVYKSIQEVKNRFKGNIPLLDPIVDMSIEDEAFKKLINKIETLEARLKSNELSKSSELESLYQQYDEKMQLDAKIKAIKKQIKQATSIMQMEELKCRKRVLRRLGFTSASDVIEMKGRVACEISTGDELLLTEMIFNGAFNDLNVEQIASMLSCFVFEEKSEQQVKLKEELAGPLRIMQETARRIARVSNESKLQVDEEEYVARFRPELMDVVYQWCKGAKFAEIIKMTDVFEGSIIRTIKRLEELLRQMCAAAKAIGNTELESKFAEGITKIKRDIVFAASLYL